MAKARKPPLFFLSSAAALAHRPRTRMGIERMEYSRKILTKSARLRAIR